jgi:cytochrome d ubiquinol oxidase subunit I
MLLAASGSATDLLAARYQMALSLGWHIVLAAFGVAFPLMIFVLHRRGLRGDEAALRLAKRWSKVAGVLFAIGAVSGTILSFEMGMLWPGLMGPFGDVIGLPFALEGISFFTEAIFLGIYLYGWNRLPGRIHSLLLVPVAIAGATGTFFILAVNAWMNSPEGFRLVAGQVTDVRPLDALFTAALPHEYIHMYVAAFMVVGFTVAAVYAAGMLRGRTDHYHRLGLWVPLAFAAVAALIQPLVGHLAGQRVAELQPAKLAAMEGQWETERAADLYLGGYYREGEGLVGGVRVPIDGLASFLAYNSFDAQVEGLSAVPPDERPPAAVVHLSFQIMVAIGTGLAALSLLLAWWWWRRRDRPLPRLVLAAVVAAGPAAVVALEAGWVTTEVGRQPWIVYGVTRTADAVTDVSWIWVSFGVITGVYALLTVAAVAVLRAMTRSWRAGEEPQAPYGPPEPLHAGEPEGTPAGR